MDGVLDSGAAVKETKVEGPIHLAIDDAIATASLVVQRMWVVLQTRNFGIATASAQDGININNE